MNNKIIEIIDEIEKLQEENKKLKQQNILLKDYIDTSVLFTATLMDWQTDTVKRLWNQFYKDYKESEGK